jgi:hypothetical protein
VSITVPEPATAAAPTAHAGSATPAPAPVATAGPVVVYSGAAGTDAAQQTNAEQPVQLDLVVAQAGLNPVQIVDDVTNHLPGGNP